MDAGLIIGIIFGILGLFALIFLLAKFASPKARGERGEARTSAILQQYVAEVGGYVIDDVILPYGKGTQQMRPYCVCTSWSVCSGNKKLRWLNIW